ncbi:hypothetical protein M9Y10_015309 [Tritrichomonas musculus]|uniref:Uncharacterized protein n=1 Tax=Tritrichomonas musculus TaxID=1915356 RepID=A0ABR2L563_9EUKA
MLGIIYYEGKYIKQNINKGISFLMLSSNNGFVEAQFSFGFLCHEGKNLNRDIKKSIKLYKEASSFNYQYAKNNLGIIYKNGYGDEISKNIEWATIYFEEAIKQSNDKISMYNLSHIYIYDESSTPENIEKSIDLLIDSSNKGFDTSKLLLCLMLIKKYGSNLVDIKNELKLNKKCSDELISSIIQFINSEKLNDQIIFEDTYQQLKKIDFVYNAFLDVLPSIDLNRQQLDNENKNESDINSNFLNGFGIDN